MSASEAETTDAVSDTLLDALADHKDPAIVRVANEHDEEIVAKPQARDYGRTLRRCPELVAVWSVDDTTEVVLKARGSGAADGYKRVRVTDGATVSNVAGVAQAAISDLIQAHGRPDLAPYDDYQRHFLDGDAS